ncbi:uncharacterized protein EV420DRAFT_854640 [Desarmillaria tabescens]|uniref:Zn(2)-C6 fungal-type domain-containing protein n=1 Tax=Armillaria tabescens TaxID=1929756 RepID=A0AA39MW26_ARMTA|nr:uncharacterized protein EV420DRAFT_854640 [Desarmillaria tabescens]KAK0448338.1 hypothetical protein EV420DRAFT_854640 [Desarmillaria tabescens]
MTPIRPHHKSRSGCKTCKQRKVKCDEDFPICKNCTRRGIECVWNSTSGCSTKIPRESEQLRLLNTGAALSTITKWPTSSAGSSYDLLTLELMHHYSISASYSLSSDPGASGIWRSLVPKMAFDPRNHCLLHAILAFSALHMHVDSTSAIVDRYAEAASAYYYRAKLSLHLTDMEDTAADINAVFVALTLIARYEFATSTEVVPRSSDWYITIRAIRRNIETNRTQTQGSILRSLIDSVVPTRLSTPWEEEFPSSLSTLLSTSHSAPDVEELYDVSVRTAYKDSIYFLERSWGTSSNQRVGLWWYMMSATFLRLLAEERPRALIILAHYCVMMKRVTLDGPWWAKKQWGNEAARIISMLDARWAPWLGWLSSQLDEVHDTQVFDVTGVDLLDWFNGPLTQETVIGQTISSLHYSIERQ